jgi:hypothetical protein
MTIQLAAGKVRSAIRKQGFDARRRVSVTNTFEVSEIRVDLKGIYGESREKIESTINGIRGAFTWDVF